MSNDRSAQKTGKADWSRDELILALQVYVRLDGAVPDPRGAEIVALSDLLRKADIHPPAAKRENFRSPASVVMKLMNFRRLDPKYAGKGLTGGSRLDGDVWREMAADAARLDGTAQAIKALLFSADGKSMLNDEKDQLHVEAEEGALLSRLHVIRERSDRLVRAKKRRVLESTGKLSCEACDFSFLEAYGTIGEGYAECHHRRPLSELPTSRRTVLDDLAVVCANCHRMIHSRRPWLTVEKLRALVAERRAEGA